MSKALDYLIEARPQAMKNYFGFLKEAGKHLDPRTRAIISVITKVDRQTDAGFRQYLKRALNEGVSADEILDALLIAFPTLGLTKIIWAIDILIEMDLPDFQIDKLGGGGEWHEVLDVTKLKTGEAACLQSGKKRVLVFTDEGIHVYDSTCPHQATGFGMENINECYITCSKHHWKFDLRSGECVDIGNKPLNRLRHKVENQKLYVYW